MPDDGRIFIPFPRELYEDIIRFSDGRMDVAGLAEREVRYFIDETIDSSGPDFWGDRLMEVAEKYAPEHFALWQMGKPAGFQQQMAYRLANKPLVWKEVTIKAGSEVRMSYDGTQHYAVVKGGYIVDDNNEYSPSEWASKVAGGTSRNAWRDLWFREPLSDTWVPAQLLRDQAKKKRDNAVALKL